MPEHCTCGAELPPDASFCHRCGRPLSSESVPAADPPPPAPFIIATAQRPSGGPPVNFHNPVAVRIGLTMASAAALLTWLPFIQVGFAVWWICAGFFGVYLYHRRTGERLSVGNGLRMGWVTGVLTFALMTVLFTVTLVPLALEKGGLANMYREQLHSMQASEATVQQAMQAFSSPAVLAVGIVFTLVVMFGIIVCLCAAGGALGAKMISRD